MANYQNYDFDKMDADELIKKKKKLEHYNKQIEKALKKKEKDLDKKLKKDFKITHLKKSGGGTKKVAKAPKKSAKVAKATKANAKGKNDDSLLDKIMKIGGSGKQKNKSNVTNVTNNYVTNNYITINTVSVADIRKAFEDSGKSFPKRIKKADAIVLAKKNNMVRKAINNNRQRKQK